MRYKGTTRTGETAEKLGITAGSVSQWKQNGSVSLEDLLSIAKLGNTSIDWLLTGESPKALQESQKTLPSQNNSDYSAEGVTTYIPVELEEHLEAKLIELAAREDESVPDMAAQPVIEAMIARGIVTDKVGGIQLQFFGVLK